MQRNHPLRSFLLSPTVTRSLLLAFLAGFVALVIGLRSTSQPIGNATGNAITPFASDALVDSAGIVIHLSYANSPYTQNWDEEDRSQNVSQLLADLGIRHVRDSIPHPTLQQARAYARPRLARLYRDYGVRFIAPLDRRERENDTLTPDQIDPHLEDYATGRIDLDGESIEVRDLLEAIEGPNEYDKHHSPEKRDTNWVQNLQNYQSRLYSQIKANPRLANLPVVMPSLIHTKYCTSDLGSFEDKIDYGNLHPYPNYPYVQIPTGTFGWHLKHGRDCFGDKPIYITETGYMTGGGGGISDVTIAKYLSRLLPEFFLQPQVKRTYLYSLIDTFPGRRPWGLVQSEHNGQKNDGVKQFTLTPKPAYYAVKDLLNLLNEGSWDKARRQWNTPRVNLRSVNLNIEGANDTTRHLLLQKSTGEYFLLVWQQVESFNPENGNFEPPADDLMLSLPNNYQFQTLYQYDESFRLRDTSLAQTSNQLKLQVPDSLVVVQFKAR